MGRKVIDGAKGKRGRVFFNGQELCVTSWEFELAADEVDTTSSCDDGFGNTEFGTVRGTGSVEAFWDITVNPFDDPPDLRVGEYADLKLYIHATQGAGAEDGPFWAFNAGIKMLRTGVTASEEVKYSFDFTSRGTITYPTGNVSSG